MIRLTEENYERLMEIINESQIYEFMGNQVYRLTDKVKKPRISIACLERATNSVTFYNPKLQETEPLAKQIWALNVADPSFGLFPSHLGQIVEINGIEHIVDNRDNGLVIAGNDYTIMPDQIDFAGLKWLSPYMNRNIALENPRGVIADNIFGTNNRWIRPTAYQEAVSFLENQGLPVVKKWKSSYAPQEEILPFVEDRYFLHLDMM